MRPGKRATKPSAQLMSLPKYETNKRIWLWISVLLFIPCWFIPWEGMGFIPIQAVVSPLALALFALLFGIPALAIGWVVQCIAVMAGKRMRRSTKSRLKSLLIGE